MNAFLQNAFVKKIVILEKICTYNENVCAFMPNVCIHKNKVV